MSDLQTLQALARELVETERWAEAQRLLAQAFAIAPDDRHSHVLAATIALETRKYDVAESHAAQVIAADPNSMDGLFVLFRVQQETGKVAEAEMTIRNLLRLYPGQAGFYAHYANLLLSTLHVREARALLCEANRLTPGMQSTQIVELLADVVERKEGDARERLAALIRQNPENQDVALALALVLHNEHRFREAMEVIRGILRANPGDAGVVRLFLDVAVKAHWSGIPLLPVTRYGFGGLVSVLFAAVTGMVFTHIFAPGLSDTLLLLYLLYLAYAGVQPRLSRRWLMARGVQ